MSEWRQRGFVQDSDEEEDESQVESQHAKQDLRFDRRVDRVPELPDAPTAEAYGAVQDEKGSRQAAVALHELSGDLEGNTAIRTSHRYASPRRPPPSPFTPSPRPHSQEERLESPDPLQTPSNAETWFRRPVASSEPHGSPPDQRTSQEEITLRAYALPSQILGETADSAAEPSRSSAPTQTHATASAILGEFGVSALSDNSEDELNLRQESDEESNLSDYPSDLSDTELHPPATHATPHRRTAVQVVIPSSTALQRQLAEEEARRRNFRQRKPIQLHPYMLEGEIYRREVQSRGLKPVPRARSRTPPRRQGQDNAESQEEEFNPFRNDSSSPPDPEIFVSTPVAQPTRNDIQRSISAKRRGPDQSHRNSPAIQLRVPKPSKRRKVTGPLSQALATPARTSESSPVPLDIWAIPPNSPPYSSSPPKDTQMAGLLLNRNTESLPTPSNSSSLQDEPRPLPDSDSEPMSRSVQKSGGQLRRPTRVILDVQASSDSDEASSASEQEDGELQKVSKKIRGVLPASWLRMDQQAHERRSFLARQRANQETSHSPEPTQQQRGVARRVTRPSGYSVEHTRARPVSDGVVVISDTSDEDLEPSTYCQASNGQGTVDNALILAARFDDRYVDSGDDLVGMEHDRLPLPTLGGSGTKRKRQPKITDALERTKRLKVSTTPWTSKSSRLSKLTSSTSVRKTRTGSKKTRAPLPALSVMDVDLPSDVPQFLKLARRAARRDVNQARQSPRRKQIRLHTAQDTDDANAALRQWRQGLLKPKMKPRTCQRRNNGPPVADMTENLQHITPTSNSGKKSETSATVKSVPTTFGSAPRGRKIAATTLQLLQRSSTSVSKPSRSNKTAKPSTTSGRLTPHKLAPHRIAQLEGDENMFGNVNRKIAFQRGLQRVIQQSSNSQGPKQYFLNPQMARFLDDDDAIPPPLPTVQDVGEFQEQGLKGTSTVRPISVRRSRRKIHATHLDIDAREYRQPSEALFEPVSALPVLAATENGFTKQDQDVLLGLGPVGAQYPVTFDITPLKSDTYFHSDTFVGSEDLQRALSVGKPGARDLDEHAGYCAISHGSTTIRCGPWSDDTYSHICKMLETILPRRSDDYDEVRDPSSVDALMSLTVVLRLLAAYISTHLSFSDPIDRKDFTTKMRVLSQTLFDRLSTMRSPRGDSQVSSKPMQIINRALSYLLVIGTQVYQIAKHIAIIEPDVARLLDTIKSISQVLVEDIAQGTLTLYDFHEKNRLHKERENGIRGEGVLVESVVICMHALEMLNVPSASFWDLVSHELSSSTLSANHVQNFDMAWATIFSLLPFTEFDVSGIPDQDRLSTCNKDNWGCLNTLLKRLLGLYIETSRYSGSSINEYIRATFRRCYVLINDWHWKRPEQILNVIFDFFGAHGLKPLRREPIRGSATFLQDYAAAGSLGLAPDESSFHMALKCLATGLQGMVEVFSEKKLRSFVFRRIPNHGRTCPKDQPLEEQSLAALRNHHDLLCTLYCAAPPSCRPKLHRIRDLVCHETSHREACRVSVRAWSNLTTFQLSTNEPYSAAKPFALWYKDIMHETLKQYRLAKTEADDYLKSGSVDESTKVVAVMVKQTMEKNQEQVIATLRDSIAGMKHAISRARHHDNRSAFLADSDIVHLLELPHLEDRRLVVVIRETLLVLRQYASLQVSEAQQHVSQSRSEDSQDYGDFPDLDDLDEVDNTGELQTVQRPAALQPSSLDLIKGPLWHLMSNAFGAEHSPDDNLLLECIDTWVLIASCAVSDGRRSWSCYIDSFSQVSWKQLRPTEQTRKFAPYFMATLINRSYTAYKEHRQEVMTALLCSLADRESMLRFQHRLLEAIMVKDDNHPLLRNLPFFRVGETGAWDITADSLRTRRLALISSLLANMREDVSTTAAQEPVRVIQVKASYTAMLTAFMTRLKSNYQQLQQGAKVAGSYVEFVQKIVQFLKQYTSDICPVLPFFTDSVAFPLPTADPTYVVARLCGYAPKVQDPRTAKELSSFIETITQQSAIDNQQGYLVDQLTRTLCTDEAPVVDRTALRTIFLQGIFPAYIERAFASRVGYLIARPILHCLPNVLEEVIFDVRVSQIDSLSIIIVSILSVAHAFIRGTEHLKGDPLLLRQPHILSGLVYTFETAKSISRLLDYIAGRTFHTTGHNRPPLTTYMEDFSRYIGDTIKDMFPFDVPSYQGDADASSLSTQYADILSFCGRSLQNNMEVNWADDQSSIWFGQGRARREVTHCFGLIEDEKERVLYTLQNFHHTLHELIGDSPIRAGIADDAIV